VCLLSYYAPGVQPDPEHLRNGARLNPDSFGFSLALGLIDTRRGFDAGEMIDLFVTARRERPDVHALFHSRKSTDTASTLENAHPFPVGRSGMTVTAHNGYFFAHAAGDDRSDSKVFAEEILPLYDLDNPLERRLLEQRMGPNRAVVLSVSGHHERSAYILNKDQGITLEDGSWHSNAMFLGVQPEGCRLCFTEDAPMVVLPSGSRICEPCHKALATRRELLMEGPSATAWR
jgi:hypothetical protein